MRIQDIQTFVALVRNRHFGRAAEELSITQPTVSSRLAALEQELGHRLVERSGSTFALTAQGEQALAVFESVQERVDGLKRALDDHSAHAPALLRIGAIDSVISTWMPHMVESLHASLPGLKIELTVESTRRLVHGMHRGEFDLVFAVDPVIGDHFRQFVSCVLQMMWVGSPRLIDAQREYSVEDLARMPIVTFPRNTPPYRQIAPYFQDEDVLASKLTSSNSMFAIINLIIDGFGVAAIPAATIRRELELGLLTPIRVAKPFPPLPILCSYQAGTHLPSIQAALDQARRSARAYCDRVDPATAWIA